MHRGLLSVASAMPCGGLVCLFSLTFWLLLVSFRVSSRGPPSPRLQDFVLPLLSASTQINCSGLNNNNNNHKRLDLVQVRDRFMRRGGVNSTYFI